MTPANPNPDADKLRALAAKVRCEVRTDRMSRILYSTDASNHQVQPLAVVFPRDPEEVAEVIAACAGLGLPVLPRGAGTSLAGQTIGRGVVLDLSKHLRRIGLLEPASLRVEAEAGAVLASVNAAAARHGLMFGPDPASADRATIGGVVGNNASGSHSIRYGMTADHIDSVVVALSDGSLTTLGPTTDAESIRRSQGNTREAALYRSALDLRTRYAGAIRERWPRTYRRASGYSLNYLTGYHPCHPPSWYAAPHPYPSVHSINLATLLCGAEGTLAVVTSARLRLVPRPRAAALAVLSFREITEACDAVPELLPLRPAAVELVPRSILDRAARVPDYARRLGFAPTDAGALLVVEFIGDSQPAVLALAERLSGRGGIVLASPKDQENVWAVRKAGLGLLMSLPGDTKPVEFVEDASVPVERLGEYVRRVDHVLTSTGTQGEWYGHASAGCLHLRPLLNLKDAGDLHRMHAIAEAVLEIVVEMGGALSGEHGDGLSRTCYNGRLFGPEILQAFRDLKQAWDPQGLMNPGKIVPIDGALSGPTDDLRPPILLEASERRTWFAFRRELDWAHAAEGCNGQGVCLKSSGVMCPSFQALHEEAHSTRGRANALRAVFSGILPAQALTGEELHAVMDLCLECKACKSECPSAVDMARMKAEYLAAYQAEHGTPLRARLFAEIHSLAGWGQRLHIVANALTPLRVTRWAQERLLGITSRRRLPRFASQRFRRQFARRPAPSTGTPVVLFVDTYTETMCPEVGQAAVEVLEACGCRVILAQGQGSCGRPMISKGLLHRARQMAERNLIALAPYAAAGVPIVGLEPSCILTLRDEYLEFFPNDERARLIADASMLIEEFLVTKDGDGRRPIDRVTRWRTGPRTCAVHGHCYTKALVGTQPTREMLQAAGWRVTEIDAGCCGMAGSFGYEKEHVDLSLQIAEEKLLPAVRAARDSGQAVCAPGFSCRGQIADGTGVRGLHPIEAVAAMLPEP